MEQRGMTSWQHSGRADLIVRAGGLAAGLLAWAAVARLAALRATPHDAGPLALLLALVAFVAGCAGAAGMTMGRHLLDTVERGARWRPAGSSERGAP